MNLTLTYISWHRSTVNSDSSMFIMLTVLRYGGTSYNQCCSLPISITTDDSLDAIFDF